MTPSPTHLLFSDIPDPDNFLMHAFHLLHHHHQNPTSHAHSAIILSPRPVSFATIPLGSRFAAIKQAVNGAGPSRTMLTPLTSAHVAENVPTQCAKWFQPDPGFEDPEVRSDTSLYMQVSALRLVKFLSAYGIAYEQYAVYADAASWSASSTILVGLHHPAHVADFTWGFDNEERVAYEDAVGEAWGARDGEDVVESKWLRRHVRDLCRGYVARVSRELGLSDAREVLRNFDELTLLNKKSTGARPDVLVGGPFTELLKYLRQAEGRVGTIVAMAGSLHRRSNLFKNQFNLGVDLRAAEAVFEFVETRRIPLRVLPTECVKGSPGAFTSSDLVKLGEVSPAGRELIRQYYAEGTESFPLFDLMAAVVMARPELLGTRRVRFEMTEGGVLQARRESEAWIAMFVDDRDRLSRGREEMLEVVLGAFGRASTWTQSLLYDGVLVLNDTLDDRLNDMLDVSRRPHSAITSDSVHITAFRAEHLCTIS